jgi:hypothetical protein
MPRPQSVLDKTQFLNVDLDIRSRSDLQPLVDAMGKKIIVLYIERFKGTCTARLELSGSHLPRDKHSQSPELIILRFCKLIGGLPPEARKLWDGARSREFDIGIESHGPMRYYWFAVASRALRAAVEIDAQIAVTVYGPMKKAQTPNKSREIALAN